MSHRFRLSRRTMLRGLGTAIALPVLDAMLDSRGLLWGTARAGTPAVPVRLFLMMFGDGTNMGQSTDTVDSWTPTTAGANYTLTPAMQSLAPVKSLTNVITGIENTAARDMYSTPQTDPGCSHLQGCTTLFTGSPVNGQFDVGGPSVDQVAISSLGLANATKFPSINAGHPYGDGSFTPEFVMSWKGKGSPVPPYTDPAKLFQDLFGTAAAGASQMNTGPALDDKSVLDFVMADITKLQARLGATDKATLDQHLTSIRQLEHTLVTTSTVSCTSPVAPGAVASTDAGSAYDQRLQAMIPLLVMALQCDLTRVVTLVVTPASDYGQLTFLPGQQYDHHSISHYNNGTVTDNRAEVLSYTNWEVQQFAQVVTALNAAPDPVGASGSTLLNNSIVFMSSEVADGNLHNTDNLPLLMAGNGGGRIQVGQCLQYPHSNGTGTSLNQLWLSVLQCMGANVTSFGVDGTSPLAGLLT